MLNREQAEHLLDAYVDMENGGGDGKVRQSLREVILDAMCRTAYITAPPLTQPLGDNWRWTPEVNAPRTVYERRDA